jgi:uncharacterized MAPEG superfamily protein
VWIVGRLWYAVGYVRDPKLRSGGFAVSTIAWAVLMVSAVIGIGRALLGGGS